jgi:hypothetical protein
VAAALATTANAQTNMSASVKNIVFVHGARADGSYWSKAIPLPQAKELHVSAVQNPLTSLADDVTRRPARPLSSCGFSPWLKGGAEQSRPTHLTRLGT